MKIKVIINAAAGADDAEAVAAQLAAIFDAAECVASISLAHDGTEIDELTRAALREDFTIIAAGGGDGTINAVAALLLGSGKALGILPLGTFNFIARDLNIPLDVEGAARTLITGHAVDVDVGAVNGHLFFNNSSLGLYPALIRDREKTYQRWGRGRIMAFLSLALTLARPTALLKTRFDVDGQQITCRTPLVFIGNNKYQLESYNLTGGECLDRGEFVLYITRSQGRLGMLWLGIRALFGKLEHARDVRTLCAQDIWIETRRKHLNVAIDGEIMRMKTPLHYRRERGVLRVITPRDGENID